MKWNAISQVWVNATDCFLLDVVRQNKGKVKAKLLKAKASKSNCKSTEWNTKGSLDSWARTQECNDLAQLTSVILILSSLALALLSSGIT